MRVVIQRVSEASVSISGLVHGAIGQGLMILVGICEDDGQEDVDWLAKKICSLRIFDDDKGDMNKSVTEVGGEALVVRQFTLYASYKKGNRPSWFRAARHEISVPL